MKRRTGTTRGMGERVARAWREMEAVRPRTAGELHRFVLKVLGLDVPRRAMMAGSAAPFEYLAHTFFEGGARPQGDCVVWANRGGGKTHLGAAATVLDMLFKPGIQVRILGGSLEQSGRMYSHLLRMMDRPGLRILLATEPTQRRVALSNGSAVELLSQSHRSVRGTRVHKLRCDEVEEFDESVWRAAQMVTRSGECGGVAVRGALEGLSTMHRPFGLMSRLVAREGVRVFRWTAMDVVEKCDASRACEGCALWEDCRGSAKGASGFVSVEDLLAVRGRTSDEAWASEMMCRRPRTDASVYPAFDVARHVVCDAGVEQVLNTGAGGVIAGMDFGIRSPLVMLWARVHDRAGVAVEDRLVEVMGEYVERDLPLEEHLRRLEAGTMPRPMWVGVDPAGVQRNSQTGVSDVQVLRRRGYAVRVKRAATREGIERVRRRLDRGTLVIRAGCRRLIEAMASYHFDIERPRQEEPVKDGPDHLCDALRYMIVSLESGSAPVTSRLYP